MSEELVDRMQDRAATAYRSPVEDKAIEEVRNLLNQLKFSAERGAYAVGDHVAVTIDPRWNATKQVLEVRILCHAFEHWMVNFADVCLFISEEQQKKDWIVFLDRWGRGSATLKLEPSEAAVSSFTAAGASVPWQPQRPPQAPVRPLSPIPLPAVWSPLPEFPLSPSPIHATCGVVPAAVFHSQGPGTQEETATQPMEICEYGSPETWLQVTVTRQRRGEVHIKFVTYREELADATVKLALFRLDTNEVECKDEVQLRLLAGERRGWAWTWAKPLLLEKDCGLVFQVLPRK